MLLSKPLTRRKKNAAIEKTCRLTILKTGFIITAEEGNWNDLHKRKGGRIIIAREKKKLTVWLHK